MVHRSLWLPLRAGSIAPAVLLTIAVSTSGLGAVTQTGGALFPYGVFAVSQSCSALTLSGNSSTDSFDSSQGTYAATRQNASGNIGTNGNVKLSGNVAVSGAVSSPQGGSGTCTSQLLTAVSSSGNASISAGIVLLTAPLTFATPPAPTPVPPRVTQSISGSCGSLTGCTPLDGTKNLSLAPAQYGNLSVSGNTTVHFQAGVYNINRLSLSGNSQLIADSTPILLHLAGQGVSDNNTVLDLSGGSLSNTAGVPAGFAIIYGGTANIKLSGGSGSYGVVYAPNAGVSLGGGADWYGAIIASTISDSGNSAVHYDRALGKMPLAITAIPVPAADSAGWNNANVTVDYTCSGILVTSCTDPVTVATEGAGQQVPGTASDLGGNSVTVTVAISLDKTLPTIASTSNPGPNPAGWNSGNVILNFACSDVLSGIASCTFPITVTTEGTNQVETGTAVDKAGNIATTLVTLNIDKTAPTITATTRPAPNGAGWNNSDVTVTYSCGDALSGVASCAPQSTMSLEGSHVVTGTAIDNAGNRASVSSTVKLDKTPPNLTIASPANGSTISLSSTSINITGAASDGVSGLAGITCNDGPATLTGSSFTCNVSLVQGANAFVIKAVDVAGNITTLNLNLTYAPAPLVTITSPTNLSVTNLTPVTVNGAINDPGATLKINGIPAPQSSGVFSMPVPLVEGLNVLTAVATNANGVTGTVTAQITLDTTPPHITIDSPADGAATTDASVTVTGLANDVVVGTVNAEDVQVSVNGISAQVANRTYSAANVPLVLGPNHIQAMGRDRAGNGTTTSITITRVLPSQPPAPPIGNAVITYSLGVISGNNQTGAVGAALMAPLVVALKDSLNNPAANQMVVFKVTGGNGSVSNGSTTGAAVPVTTDASGQAQVFWTLGQRAGAGINTVQVSSPLAFGTSNFTATASTANAAQIVLDSGNNQTGVLGQPLAFPFVVIVTDSGFNRVPGVQVTFSVTQGGGNIDGAISKTVTTDSNGRSISILTIGLQEGIQNMVSATFPGNPGQPVTFTALPKAPGNPANTTISGVVLDNSNNPIPGVTLRLFQTNQGNFNNLPVQIGTPVQTNVQGTFLIPSAPVGFFKLMADGSTAASTNSYPTLEYDIVTVAGIDNTVGTPIYLPALDTVNKLCVDETHGGTLTLPQVPGFALTVSPGSATFPGGSHQGCVSVTPVHGDKVPMAPGFGQQPRFIVTIQPVGTTFNPPAPITLPNVDGLKPSAITEMYSYDHDLSMFVAIGTGTVSPDGSKIVSNPGVGVLKAGWHCGGDPNSSGSSASLSVSINPTNVSKNVNDTADFTAAGGPPLDGVYSWELISTQSGDDPSAATLISSPSCADQSSCTATIQGAHGGKLTLRVHFVCTTTGTEVTADARITINVKPTIMSLTYSGAGFHNVAKDADGSAYGTPQWVDANLNGTATDPGDSRFPVSYTRNSAMTVGAVFKLSGTVTNANAKITGDGGGLHFENTVTGFSGDTLTLPDTAGTGNLPNTIKKLNPLQITWNVSFDDTDGYPSSSFQTAGTTDNVIHVTLSDPGSLASPLYETILDIGTRNADGQSDATTAVSSIWSNFAALNVRRADGVQMGYWTGGAATCQSLNLMLASPGGDGSCVAWSQLFHQTLEAQGITGSQIYQITANTTVNPSADGFQVKNWNFGKHVRTGANGLNDSNTAGDDFTLVPKGKGFPSQLCIGPGPNGVLDTAPGPGNVVSGVTITTGANGICSSTAAGDDVQVIAVGKGGPGLPAITPGTNGKLESVVLLDDTTQDGLFLGTAYPYVIFSYTNVFGPDGVAFGDSAEQPGIPGQKNPNPPPIFFNHFIVEYAGMVWDPSYGAGPFGGANNGENAHENAAIDGIKSGGRAKKHDTAVKELRYDRASSLE